MNTQRIFAKVVQKYYNSTRLNNIMMNSGKIQQRIDPELKHDVEAILEAQGIKPAQAILMLYHEIKRRRGFPFVPSEVPSEEFARDLREAKSGKGIRMYRDEKHMFADLKK